MLNLLMDLFSSQIGGAILDENIGPLCYVNLVMEKQKIKVVIVKFKYFKIRKDPWTLSTSNFSELKASSWSN